MAVIMEEEISYIFVTCIYLLLPLLLLLLLLLLLRFTAIEQNKLCGVEQRAPPIFARAAMTFGIGPYF